MLQAIRNGEDVVADAHEVHLSRPYEVCWRGAVSILYSVTCGFVGAEIELDLVIVDSRHEGRGRHVAVDIEVLPEEGLPDVSARSGVFRHSHH